MTGYGYVLIAPCGCVRVAEIDDKHCRPKTLAAEAVARGYHLERWTCDRIRTQSWRCDSSGCPFQSPRQEALL